MGSPGHFLGHSVISREDDVIRWRMYDVSFRRKVFNQVAPVYTVLWHHMALMQTASSRIQQCHWRLRRLLKEPWYYQH